MAYLYARVATKDSVEALKLPDVELKCVKIARAGCGLRVKSPAATGRREWKPKVDLAVLVA